jgi:hypothetical protein
MHVTGAQSYAQGTYIVPNLNGEKDWVRFNDAVLFNNTRSLLNGSGNEID